MRKLAITSIIILFFALWLSGCGKESKFSPWEISHWEKIENQSEKIKECSSYVHGDFFETGFSTVNPSNPNVILLKATDYCIKYSENAGKNWNKALLPINGGALIMPKNAQIIYCIDSFLEGVEYFAFPYYSLDFGKTWKRSNLPPLPLRPDLHNTIVADPQDPNILYAVTVSGVFKSVKGKGAYEYYPVSDTVKIPYIYVDPEKPDCLYVTLLDYRSTDPSANPYISSSVTFKSIDGGKTWEKLGNFYLNPSYPETYIKTVFDITPTMSKKQPESKLYVSLDGGKNFTLSDIDLNKNSLYSILIGKNGVVYADTYLGLFKSLDNGMHFVKVAEAPKEDYWDLLDGNSTLNSKIAISPTNPNVVYWASQCLKSTDGGKTWVKMNVVRNEHVNGSAIAVDPLKSNTIYLGVTFVPSGEPAPSKPINKPSIQKEAPNPFDVQGIYRSNDGGRTWEKIGLDGSLISVITISRKTGIIYAGTYSNGLFRSVDAGKTWERIELDKDFHLSVSSLAIDSRSNVVYIGILGGGVFKIEDKK